MPAADGDDDTATPVDSTASTDHAGGDAGSMASLLRQVASTGGNGALVAGTLVGGQYRIERAVGAGGMGVVYLANDERLGRPVAIKLGAARSVAALARLQREAGALAKLSHPNVVTVYQVGEHEGRVFIAMEYVTGGTARSWAATERRGWREIVTLYAAAGDGLAAAHAAGLVHRDFKPDNVLVGGDGRPRVADFGLVRAIAVADERGEPTGETRDLAETRAGAIMGTPAYMPPEQLAGEEVDPRADQFAFCASVWEALFGARPFGGSTPAEVKAAIESAPPAIGDGGERRPRVPRHVLEALRRGLRPARDERWPAMPALLAALRHDPAARRRRVALVLGGAAIAGAVAIPLALRAAASPDPCTDGPAVLARTWHPGRADTLARALGPQVWPRVEERLQAYARAWTIGHREACRATRVARSQSEDVLDRRMHCLERARVELDATLAVFDRGGASVAGAAADAVGRLPDLTACADVAALAEQLPLPVDPAARAKIADADALIAAAHAADLDRGRLDPVGKAERALAAARAAAWKPQLAFAIATHAAIIEEAGRGEEARKAYDEAAQMALAVRADDVAAHALADLAWSLSDVGRIREAELALGIARAAAERVRSRLVKRRVLGAAAMVAARAARYEEALAIRRELIAMTERDPQASPDWPSSDRFNLAAVLQAAGKAGEAEVAAAEAVELAERVYGSTHPTVGKYLALLAATREAQGKHEEGAAAADRALAILEAWYGPDDPRLTDALEIAGTFRRHAGKVDEARALWERQLAITRRTGLADAPIVQQRLAILMVETGDLAGAAAAGAEIVATVERIHGPAVRELLDPLLLVAYVARERGEIDAALRDFRRALAIGEATVGGDHPAVHNLRVELGKTLVADRKPADARALLEPALAAILKRTDLDPTITVEAHLVLADALWALGERGRARALAADAAMKTRGAEHLTAMVDGWRATHR